MPTSHQAEGQEDDYERRHQPIREGWRGQVRLQEEERALPNQEQQKSTKTLRLEQPNPSPYGGVMHEPIRAQGSRRSHYPSWPVLERFPKLPYHPHLVHPHSVSFDSRCGLMTFHLT